MPFKAILSIAASPLGDDEEGSKSMKITQENVFFNLLSNLQIRPVSFNKTDILLSLSNY